MLKTLRENFARLRQFIETEPRLVQWKARYLPDAEKFLIAGPTLVGFVFGLVRYEPKTQAFETGFQSMVFFLAYLVALIILQTLDSLFFSSWPVVLGVARSMLATVYLGLTLRQFWQWRKGEPQILERVSQLRNRAKPLIGDAT